MRPDDDYIEYDQDQEGPRMGQKFPTKIEIRMFYNYRCYECKTRLKMPVSIATYTNPQIADL